MNWKTISRNVGMALLVSALFMFFSVIVSIANGNDSALAALSISCLITLLVGAFPFIFVKKTKVLSLKEGYVIITLSWLLSFIFGMLPYALWGGPFDVQNAMFEAVSGYTTCGATILDNIEALPNSLLCWRASTHFIGGLGIVVFLLLIIPESSNIRMRLTNMELSNLSKSGYSLHSTKVVYIFAIVYFGIFIFAFVAYLLAGMNFIDAICHSMSVAATGGFSTKNISIAAFDSRLIEGITMLCMYLSSLHFGVLYVAVITRSLRLFKNEVIKWYSISLLILAFVMAIGLKSNDLCSSWGSSLWVGLFNSLSVASTTGFGIVDNALWPSWMIMFYCLSGIVCACAGSTSGGIKMDRALILIKSIANQVRYVLNPSSVSEVRIGRKIVKNDDISAHTLYMCLFFLLIIISTILSSCFGIQFEESLVSSVMSISCVGPACGEFSIMSSFNSVPLSGKLLYCFDMFLGRVEIYPVLAFVGMLFNKSRK